MLLRNLGRIALAATTALFPSVLASSNSSQSTFVSPDNKVSFAITVADDHQNDLYFSIRAKSDLSWAAIGLGSDDMPGALYLIIYKGTNGNNVTFSPRLSSGHYEPKYYDELEYSVLDGTGVDDDYMTFTARCIKHCRSWPSGGTSHGHLDVSSPNQKGIYAYGATEGYYSDYRDAPLKYHRGYGSFSIDIARTKDSTDMPKLTDSSKTDGAELLSSEKSRGDWKSALHGFAMILCIAVLMPIGVVLLRSGGMVKWHAINQTVSMVGALLGFALGIVNSFSYQRSRGFSSTHQILGFVVIGLIMCQFALGVLHHTKFKKTNTPTKFGKIHIWVGRVVLFFGVLNCFVGFTFALNRKYGMVLAAIVIFVCFGGFFFILGKQYLDNKKRRLNGASAGFNPAGYNPAEPWQQQPPPQYSGPSDAPPGYEAPSHQINLGAVPPRSPSSPSSPWQRSTDRRNDDENLDLGTQHRPKEFT